MRATDTLPIVQRMTRDASQVGEVLHDFQKHLAQLEHLLRQTANVESTLAERQAALTTLEAEIVAAHTRRDEAQCQAETVQQELMEITSRRDQLRSEVERMKAHIGAL